MVQFSAIIQRFNNLDAVLLPIKYYDVIHKKNDSLGLAVPAIIKECGRKLYLGIVLIPHHFI